MPDPANVLICQASQCDACGEKHHDEHVAVITKADHRANPRSPAVS